MARLGRPRTLEGVDWRLDFALFGAGKCSIGDVFLLVALDGTVFGAGDSVGGAADTGVADFGGLPRGRLPIIMENAFATEDTGSSTLTACLADFGADLAAATLLERDDWGVLLSEDTRLFLASVNRSTTLFSKYARMSVVLSLKALYKSVCSLVMGAYRTYSRFLGKYLATSDLTRRSSSGCKTTCIFFTNSCFALSAMNSSVPSSSSRSLKSNQLSKASQSRKILGRRKFSKDHSSLRLFCKGVPVMRRRVAEVKVLSSRKSLESKFFMRCPSSCDL